VEKLNFLWNSAAIKFSLAEGVHIRLAQDDEFPGSATQEKEKDVGPQLHQLPHCMFAGRSTRPAGGYACDYGLVGAYSIEIKNATGSKAYSLAVKRLPEYCGHPFPTNPIFALDLAPCVSHLLLFSYFDETARSPEPKADTYYVSFSLSPCHP
jgi:hypothetical protein